MEKNGEEKRDGGEGGRRQERRIGGEGKRQRREGKEGTRKIGEKKREKRSERYAVDERTHWENNC